MRRYFIYSCVLFSLLSKTTYVQAQLIRVNADSYKQQFEGAGVSIGLYLGHHSSMNDENKDKAIRFIVDNCNMLYLQDYIQIYPSDDPAYFDRRADYFKAARQYRPEIKVSMVGNKFPDNLMKEITVDGEVLKTLNTDDPLIYDKLAKWWFELFKGFKERGVSVEILNVVNEPDLDRIFRKYHYGLNGNTKVAVAHIFEKAVPMFKAMFGNAEINHLNMPTPLIMGPSTISPAGCLEYIRLFKANHPTAWQLIDIVSLHQYIGGTNEAIFKSIIAEIENKPFHQSETHANMGDDLGKLPISDAHRAALSVARLFGVAVSNGINAWYYFENNYPHDFSPGGLMQVTWESTNPLPYKHYYAFRQLTSYQPAFSNLVSRDVLYSNNSEITCFRKRDEDTVYVHVSNFLPGNRSVTIDVKVDGQMRKLNSYSLRVTNADLNDEMIVSNNMLSGAYQLQYTVSGYSVNSFKIALYKDVSSVKAVRDFVGNTKVIKLNGAHKIIADNGSIIQSIEVFNLNGTRFKSYKDINSSEFDIINKEFTSGLYVFKVITETEIINHKVLM
ncbi:MAG: T9SS type A sorting domain-containing protein [Lentimicrobium sp.]|nr:T9SS type A sorting domain-containing protein [Lentimicrobium sp.]